MIAFVLARIRAAAVVVVVVAVVSPFPLGRSRVVSRQNVERRRAR